MDRIQAAELVNFLHGRIQSTAADPVPSISWATVTTLQLRQAWRAVPVTITAFPAEELENDLLSLVRAVSLLNHALPHLTRASLTALDTWLTDVDQVGKSNRLGLAYPNDEGIGDTTDVFISLQEFSLEVQQGAEHLTKRLINGLQWLAFYDQMQSSLGEIKYLMPKVALGKNFRQEMIAASEVLMHAQERFWALYKVWVTERLSDAIPDNGLRKVRCVYRNIVEMGAITFANQITAVRTGNFENLLVFNANAYLSPDTVPGLSVLWESINKSLKEVGSTAQSTLDKNAQTSLVLTGDITRATIDLDEHRAGFTEGARECQIYELSDLLKRLNTARENGCLIDETVREGILMHKSVLLEDKSQADSLRRHQEAVAKARVIELSKAAPKIKLIPLTGFDSWLSWRHMAKELTSNLTNEQSKCSLVFESLKEGEDRKHLQGLTSFSEMMSYLTMKYNRPFELVASILAKGTRLPFPGDSQATSKANMLCMLEIRRDLRKCKMQAKIDSFYISTVALRIFTTLEMSRYLRESSEAERAHEKQARRLAATRRESTMIPGEDGLDAISHSRHLSGDESDDATEIYSFVSNSEAVDQDSGSRRTRRFFFSFIESLIANIRRLESNLTLLGREDKSKLKGGKDTRNYHVEAGEGSCILKSCGKTHLHPKFKRPTQSLAFCPHFASLKPEQRRKVATVEEVCTRCLTVGHRYKTCKSSLVCKHCGQDSHSVLLCRTLNKGSGKDKAADGKKAKKKEHEKAAVKKAAIHKIEASEDEAEASAGESEVVEIPYTEAHFGKNFSLSSVESFFLEKSSKVDMTLTMVSTVFLKNGSYDYETQAMWDQCSTDHWCTESVAKRLNAKKLSDWTGAVKTINGIQSKTLARYLIKIKRDNGDYISLTCFATDVIGWKPQIESIRLTRLCKAFGVPTTKIDNELGAIDMLVGLKCQSLQASRVAKFVSDEYPEVGLYETAATRGYIFVGATEGSMKNSNFSTINYSCKTVDSQLRNFLEAENEIKVDDIICESCNKSQGCPGCKKANNPASIQEMLEDAKIKEALVVTPGIVDKSKSTISLEYPIKPEIDLAYLYSASRSNKSMARMSSLNLRKKLSKDGKLLDFHEKVMDCLDKGHCKLVTTEVEKEHSSLPQSWQLINYVVKESSASTKIRMVTNSSVQRFGGSYNDACMVGSCLLNSSLTVLNGWSCYPFCFITDLSEAYRSIGTGPVTNSCRRFSWFTDVMDPETQTDFMLQVMTFGDRPAGNILSQALGIIANDHRVSQETRKFILGGFYVDDGLLSSRSQAKLERISGELTEAFLRYGFNVKHIIQSWRKSVGITATESTEKILGLEWDFAQDTLVPALNVYLCKKKRGEHVDVELDKDVIDKTQMTLRVLLRCVGSLYDLSGRFISPLQMKGRLLYSKTTKLGLGWDQHILKSSPEINAEIIQFLHEVIAVKQNLKVMKRAWVPMNHQLTQLICSYDGSISGYSSTVHARSAQDDSHNHKSNIASGRCKTSQLDCGDNELSGGLLASRLMSSVVESLPEIPDDLVISFIGDSQCTAYCHNPEFVQKDRRRRNLSVKWSRTIRRLHGNYPDVPILLVWTPGARNPSDLNSKSHPHVDQILNGNMWRHGPPEYSGDTFPGVHQIVYGWLRQGTFVFKGFPSSSQHFANCVTCHHVDNGQMVANELVGHQRKLADGCLTAGTASSRPRSVAQFSIESESSQHPVQTAPTDSAPQVCDVTSDSQPLDKPVITRKILGKFSEIGGYVNSVSLLICRAKKTNENYLLTKLNVWWRTIQESQRMFPPSNIKQCLPETLRGVLGTKNRLTSWGLATYHKVPTSILPIVSHHDKLLCDLLWSEAHIKKDESGSFHLTKSLTLLRIKSGFFGCHLTNAGKFATEMLRRCVECQRHKIKLNISRISDKWPLRMSGIEKGIWSCISIDLIGPYRYQTGPTTRQNKTIKTWILVLVCQLSSAVNFAYLEDYSTKSFLQAFSNHGSLFRYPSVCTADQGSQIKSAAKRITRSMTVKHHEDCDEEHGAVDTKGWNQMLADAAKKFKQTQWHFAPVEAQSMNGKCEGNIRIVKSLLRSHSRLLRGQRTVFGSFLTLQAVFCKIMGLMNSRPLIYCNTECITVRDLYAPAFISSPDDEDTIGELVVKTDEHFKEFVSLFNDTIISGSFQKFGRKSKLHLSGLRKDDFVCCYYPSKMSFKYGILTQTPKGHMATVKILTRRNRDGSGTTGEQVFDCKNVSLLFRPTEKNIAL